jgi:long-chain acyl-CoA synthetase
MKCTLLEMPKARKIANDESVSPCSVNWISVSHACASQGISIVTAYDTLGESGVEHSLVQTDAEVMYVDPHLLKTAAGPIRKSKVRTVIVNEDSIFTLGGEIEAYKKDNPDIRVITWEDLRKLGEENPVDPQPGNPSDVFCVMYTSGSTGLPKGACITHEALVAGGMYLPLTSPYSMYLQILTLADSYGPPRLCRRDRQ